MSRCCALLVVSIVAAACGGSPTKVVEPGPGSGSAMAVTATGSATPAAAEAELPLDPTVRHGELPNGLAYFIKPNKKPDKRVMLWLAVNTGSGLETDAQRGLAHMVEHLAFDGTKRFPKHDIQDFIERAGMQFGADLNAYTSFDETVFQLMVPTDDPATVARGLDVLRDWAHDITFDPQATIDERKIVQEERRLRNSSGLRLLYQIYPVEYAGGPYGQRFPIGLTEIIDHATGDQLRAYYDAWYHPENMAVLIVGDIDPAAIDQAIHQKFGDLPRAAAGTPARPALTVETSHAPRYVVARDKENTLFQVRLAYQMTHRPERTAADARRELVESVFERLMSERLDILAKRAGAPWTTASASFESPLRPVDEFALEAQANAGKLADAITGLETELARVRQHGFSADEIRSGTAELLQHATEQAREVDTRESAAIVQDLVNHYLTGAAVPGPQAELELAKTYLPTITSDDLKAVASADRSLVVVLTAPATGDVPAEKDALAAVAAGDKAVGDWQAVDLSAPLLASDPAPGKITGDKALTQGATMWTLSNGARVFVKVTPFKKDEIRIAAVSNGGFSVVKDADYPQAKHAADVVNAMGFGNYAPEELQKKLAGKKVELAAGIDADGEHLDGDCSPDDVEPMLQLVNAAFTAPRKDAGAFAKWKAQQQQLADVLGANPEVKFLIAAFDKLFQNNVRQPLPFAKSAEIAAVDADKALAQYKARFANAGDFDFVIVGAVDVAKLRPLVEKYLASLPATKAKREVVGDPGLRLAHGKLESTIKAGTEAKSMSLLFSTADTKWSLAADWDSDVLSHVLDIELLAVLRAKLGGTYTVQAQAGVERAPPQHSALFVLFESAPDTAKSLQDEAWATLERIATSPISDDTLAKVREQLQKKRQTDLEDNGFWVDRLSRVARYGDDLDKLVNIDLKLARATKDQIQKTARLFVSAANRATLQLQPEK